MSDTVRVFTLSLTIKVHALNFTVSLTIRAYAVTHTHIQINGTEIEKVTNYKNLRQTIAMENRTKQEVLIRVRAGCSVFGKYREIFLDRHHPMSLRRKFFLTNGNGIWMSNMVSYKSISKEI